MTPVAGTHMTRTRESVHEDNTRVSVWDPCPTCWASGRIYHPDEYGVVRANQWQPCHTCLGMRCVLRGVA